MLSPRISELVLAAREACQRRTPGLAVQQDVCIDKVMAQLDAANPWLGYHHIPREVQSIWTELHLQLGEQGLADHLQRLLTNYIESFDQRFSNSGIPEVFVPEFERSFERVLRLSCSGELVANPERNIFLKDLAIARLRLVPCVSHLIHRYSGVPRRVILKQSPSQIPELLTFFRRTRGFRPFLENHVHPGMLEDFNPEGRERCYKLVAQLLRAWPESKGLIGASWYYDPSVKQISAHLGYLHDVPFENGALIVKVATEGADSGALARSVLRRRLFESGDYVPHTYLMVWPRHDLLRYTGV